MMPLWCAIPAFILFTVTPLFRAAQCGIILDSAKAVASRLQDAYYNEAEGKYNRQGYTDMWTDANTIEDIHNWMLGSRATDFDSLGDDSFLGRHVRGGNPDWVAILDGSNDDAGWFILALWKIADYMEVHNQDNSRYMAEAKKIYDIMKVSWDDSSCNGGLLWSTKPEKRYKNAITNQLFMLVSAVGFLRYGDQEFHTNGIKSWNWLLASGMRNAEGLWNDGLDIQTDGSCVNNGQVTYTYNQGVIASALGALYSVTGDWSLLEQAEITLDAVMGNSMMTFNYVLREHCDHAEGGEQCNRNGQMFKGVWMKHVQYYLDYANDAARTAKYAPFLDAQYFAVENYGKSAVSDVGSVWYAPNEGGSAFTPQATASGLAALVSAAKYATCAA